MQMTTIVVESKWSTFLKVKPSRYQMKKQLSYHSNSWQLLSLRRIKRQTKSLKANWWHCKQMSEASYHLNKKSPYFNAKIHPTILTCPWCKKKLQNGTKKEISRMASTWAKSLVKTENKAAQIVYLPQINSISKILVTISKKWRKG